jgi:anti-sigma28 factor (negative regulator of flagellin synthesis)
MISGINSSLVGSAYGQFGEAKNIKAGMTTVTKQGDTSKIEKIKESIAFGEYKIDLDALSKKIADELLQ